MVWFSGLRTKMLAIVLLSVVCFLFFFLVSEDIVTIKRRQKSCVKLSSLDEKLDDIRNCLQTKALHSHFHSPYCLPTKEHNNLQSTNPSKLSPWNYYKTSTKQINLLFIQNKSIYDTDLNHSLYDIVEAAKAHPLISRVVVFGTGWSKWNSSLSLTYNVVGAYPSIYWDVVAIGDDEDDFPTDAVFGDPTVGIRTVIYREIYCSLGIGKCQAPSNFHNANVIIFTYAQTMALLIQYVTNRLQYTNRLFYHIPHAASIAFYEDVKTKRDIDVLLIGRISQSHPLRKRFYNLINEGKINAYIKAFPNIINEDEFFNEDLSYSKLLRRTKILLVSRSKHHYAIKSYVEGALAGCLLMGNVPAERQNEFKEYMVEVDEEDSEDIILQQLEWWLSHDKERQYRAKIGQQHALQKYTTNMYINQLISSWETWGKGNKGVIFPHPFNIEGEIHQ